MFSNPVQAYSEVHIQVAASANLKRHGHLLFALVHALARITLLPYLVIDMKVFKEAVLLGCWQVDPVR